MLLRIGAGACFDTNKLTFESFDELVGNRLVYWSVKREKAISSRLERTLAECDFLTENVVRRHARLTRCGKTSERSILRSIFHICVFEYHTKRSTAELEDNGFEVFSGETGDNRANASRTREAHFPDVRVSSEVRKNKIRR